MKKTILITTIIYIVLSGLILILWLGNVLNYDSNKYLLTSLISLLGFYIQVVVVIWGFRLGLRFENNKRKEDLIDRTKNLNIIINQNPYGEKKRHIRVENKSDWSIHNCCAYISINNETNDLVNADLLGNTLKGKNYLFVDRNNGKRIIFEKLSWAYKNSESLNPHKIDIYSGEIQDLMIYNILNDNFLEIASENGFSSDNGHSRCLLENKDYEFIISIVSDDTKKKEFVLCYKAVTKSISFK